MCTLSFIPREGGYYLGMNRDEQISRGPALAPSRIALGTSHQGGAEMAIYPRDVEGGTWIAANSAGAAFALLNWNDVRPSVRKARSRGHVIPQLVHCGSERQAQALLRRASWSGMMPFRLIAIFPDERRIREWRWNGSGTESRPHPWQSMHWYSSGLSDEQALLRRGAVCRSAWEQPGAGSLSWLRRLHASHTNGPVGLSICVHRQQVRTLSYTEVACTKRLVRVGYFSGSPCKMQRPERWVGMDRKLQIPKTPRARRYAK